MLTPWLFSDFTFNLTNLSTETKKYQQKVRRLMRENFDSCFKNGENTGKYFSFMKKFGETESWTMEDFLSDFIILFFGSFDTSGSTIAHILLLLAMNPECQEKLHEELKGVLKSHDDEVSEDKLIQMSYLNLVIKEGMRLIPAVLILSRQVTKPLKLGEKLE